MGLQKNTSKPGALVVQSIRIINTASHLVSSEQGNYWSILLFYREEFPSEGHQGNFLEKKPTCSHQFHMTWKVTTRFTYKRNDCVPGY
jgi:hypothetical protein